MLGGTDAIAGIVDQFGHETVTSHHLFTLRRSRVVGMVTRWT